jgi:hypothetical protein
MAHGGLLVPSFVKKFKEETEKNRRTLWNPNCNPNQKKKAVRSVCNSTTTLLVYVM